MDQIEFPANRAGIKGLPSADKATSESTSTSFGELIQQSIAEVNRLQTEADGAVRTLNTGENKDIHGTLIALEKADISFQLLMQVRNKIIAAYQEIMRLQI